MHPFKKGGVLTEAETWKPNPPKGSGSRAPRQWEMSSFDSASRWHHRYNHFVMNLFCSSSLFIAPISLPSPITDVPSHLFLVFDVICAL